MSSLAGATLLIGGIAFYIHRTNRRLATAIAEKTRTEEALKKSESWHRIIFETSPSAGIVWQPGFVVVGWNRQAEALFGWRREEVLGKRFDEFMIPEHEKSQLLPRLAPEANAPDSALLPHSINQNLTRSGRSITCEWFNAWLPERPGEPRHIIALATDITERQRLEEQIRHQAFYDALTGLPNRRLLYDRFEQVVAAARRSGQLGALLFLDLDNFKPLNDRYGHEAGDQLLVQVACRIQDCVRACDTVARFGGDEFVVLLSGLDAQHPRAIEQARLIGEKVLEQLNQPYAVRSKHGKPLEHRCTASIGIAVFDHGAKADDIIRQADHTMYQVKESGRNQCLAASAERLC